MSTDLRVLYFDDVQRHLEGYKPVWEGLLKPLFDDIEFTGHSTMDEELVEKKMPHIVIVDNVVINADGTQDDEGAKFIAKLKPKFPHIIFILFTQATFSVRTLAQLYPNPDLIVPKLSFRAADYQEKWIRPQIERLLCRRPAGNIRFSSARLSREFKNSESDIECILEQSLNSMLLYEPGAISDILLAKLTGGASGASVFLAEISGPSRLRNVPIVFRLSKYKDIQAEISNYMRYVSLQVPHNVKVELLGSGFNGEIGGALYAFALGDSDNTTTAKSIIIDKPRKINDITTRVCKEIFDGKNLGWYVFDNEDAIDVADYFSNSEEYAPRKDNRRIAGIQKNIQKFSIEHAAISGDEIRFLGKNYTLPRNALDTLDSDTLFRCICHGDLNLNNIIMNSKADRMALIDFEYSGFDHIYKDFISLEVSLLELINHGLNCASFYEAQLDSYKNLSFNQDSDSALQIVRNAFGNAFRIDKLENLRKKYLMCLAFHLFKVSALPNIEEQHFKNMLASLCAAMKALGSVTE